MKSLFLIFCVFTLFFTNISFAQSRIGGGSGDEDNTSTAKMDMAAFYLTTMVKPYKKSQHSTENFRNSGISIQQIGSYNSASSNIKASNIDVSITQKGNNNQLVLDKSVNDISQKVVQEGDFNTISDFSLYANYSVKTEITQNGDNHSFQNFGTNSLSKNMKVIQSGSGASVIIINKGR